ncbi:hypothetical protein [[Clostridium] symbiosum]|uniref:hypothetical protein n=1 Tax=Clostridium symbiosum TaxID=1512 RepID=UPI0036F1D3FB
MYFITTKRMLEVCFSAHPNIQYRTFLSYGIKTRHIFIYLHIKVLSVFPKITKVFIVYLP